MHEIFFNCLDPNDMFYNKKYKAWIEEDEKGITGTGKAIIVQVLLMPSFMV